MKKDFSGKLYKYLGIEIGIEYKACLYFFCIGFFLMMYLLINKEYYVRILFLAEMIFSTYIMCYVQYYILNNFDETEKLCLRDVFSMVICSMIYGCESFFFEWFDKKIMISLIFSLYIMFAYICMALINKIKRNQDTKNLNDMLNSYKRRR